MNLPNKLTISRIVLTFIFMFFLLSKGLFAKSLALLIFLVASLTDFYDGRIAKRRGLVTDFGKLMDPIADKVLTLAAFLGFVELKLIPAWMAVLIISRELVITSLRIMAAKKGKVLAATASGKHKTVSQMVAIFIILSFLVLREAGMSFFGIWNPTVEGWFKFAIFVLMLVTVILTLISGGLFLTKNKGLFLGGKAN